jgi:hypothetical protein
VDTGGGFGFNGTYTQGVVGGTPIAFSGINLADFELGQYSSYSINQTPDYGQRLKRLAGFFQDDWRVRPNLTLNLGLRYETVTPPDSPFGVFQSFDPYVPNPGAGNGSIPAGAMGITTFPNLNGQGKYLWPWLKHEGFQPRFGFAYRINGSSTSVVRGGFGIFFDDQYVNGVNPALGFNMTISQSYTANTNPAPFAGPTVIPTTSFVLPPKSALTPTFGDIGTAFPQSSISFFDPKRANPYSMEYNLDVQHQWKGILVDVGYIGTFGRHMPTSYGINLVPPNLLSETSVPIALRRPFTEFTGSNASVSLNSATVFVSDYNALTFKTDRRYANGLTWTTAFTWSKWISNDATGSSTSGASDNPSFQNIYNLAGERSLTNADVPYRFVFSPIYELPLGKGKPFLNQGGVVNQVVGGWQVALMGTLQAGQPEGPTVNSGGTNYLQDPEATLRPNLVSGCSPYLNKWQTATGGITGYQYFNPGCFTTPANFTYGNQSRELPNVLGPGIAQFNLSVEKNFPIKERFRLQFRAEAVDVFNTPRFSDPAETYLGGNFGIITSSDGITKRIMDFGMKIFF